MKKILFLLIAIATLMSCQKEELIPEPQQELDEIDTQLLEMVNQVRTNEYVVNGITYSAKDALIWDFDLKNVSKIQTTHMDENNDWCIVWEDGTDLNKRFNMANCDYKPRFEGYVKLTTPTCPKKLAIDMLIKTYAEILMSDKYNIVAITQTGRYWSIILAYKVI